MAQRQRDQYVAIYEASKPSSPKPASISFSDVVGGLVYAAGLFFVGIPLLHVVLDFWSRCYGYYCR